MFFFRFSLSCSRQVNVLRSFCKIFSETPRIICGNAWVGFGTNFFRCPKKLSKGKAEKESKSPNLSTSAEICIKLCML